MIIYPAIDLRGGQVVRLKQGDPAQQTIFSSDPIAAAQDWIDQGAEWIHVVNLDGAFASANDNLPVMEGIARLDISVQFGGGLRQLSDMQRALDGGAARLVLGTLAIEQPQVVIEAVEQFGTDRICVALDARDGKVATHGWQQVSDQTPTALGKEMYASGVRHALYTDIHRDGELSGVNVDATVNLARATSLQVIASGGVSTIDEIKQLAASGVVAGAIIGMALYEKRITLPEAIKAAGV